MLFRSQTAAIPQVLAGHDLIGIAQTGTGKTAAFTLPYRLTAGGNLYYGSGFTDGSSDEPAHLEGHTTFDLTVGKTITENLTLSATALNLTNRRFLLDNSATFGGTHYADPRQVYVQLKYRFHY